MKGIELVPYLERLLLGKQLLIFDFDGTIANTSSLHAAAFEKVLSSFRVPVDYPSIAGMKTIDAIRYCAGNQGLSFTQEELTALVIEKQILVREMIASCLKPVPRVDQFLRWASRYYRLSIATSGSRETVTLALKKLGYLSLFDPLVCSDDVTRAKPHPDAFTRVLALTNCPPERALIFEDSESGCAAAESAGIGFIKVSTDDWGRFFR